MSRFFRSSADSDSSSSAESGDEDTDHGSVHSAPILANALTLELSGSVDNTDGSALTLPATTAPVVGHRDMLLHALLEERCLNEAVDEHGGNADRGDPAVQSIASRKYRQLCAQLAPYGLISAGLEADDHLPTRQRYRDGLDLLLGNRRGMAMQAASGNLSVPVPMKRLLLGSGPDPATAHSLTGDFQALQLSASLNSVPRSIASAIPAHPLLDSSRYQRDFEELGVLGKGGYGVVYHVQHKLDGLAYAVKKVPLSSTRLQKIETRGQSELDDILKELRTLARLDHPNIVRYFSGWIEWTKFGGSVVSTSESRAGLLLDNNAAAGAQASLSGLSLGRIATESTSNDAEVLFESSAPLTETSNGSIASSDRGLALINSETRSTTATVSDEDVESISRDTQPERSSSMFLASDTNGTPHAHGPGEPILALHMQMALYPLTLADFLSPPSDSCANVAPLAHCFHIEPSLNIMLAILDGVDYLHSEGIAHRDLKPGNIFLGPNSSPRNTRGSVDLFLCSECRDAGVASPITLNVRIGDFGLVTAAADPDAGVTSSHPVGTEIYRPIDATSTSDPETLDVFALGVIFFELLRKFNTRMERLETLSVLKRGHFTSAVERNVLTHAVMDCIQDMLGFNRGNTVRVRDVSRRLARIREQRSIP